MVDPHLAKCLRDPRPPLFIALSGGVDSAVAASILKKQDANLIGISHIVWPESRCCSSQCLDRSRKQCDDLAIPYLTVDCILGFCHRVLEPFVRSYLLGNTPNPCVLCNETIRFSEMIESFFRANPVWRRPDYQLATGHYVRIAELDGHQILRKAKDQDKDQSYMLYRLDAQTLKRLRFPLGNLQKNQVRELARQQNLSAAHIQDSQDACFISGYYNHHGLFIEHYAETQAVPGDFIDLQGKILGKHCGYFYYTRGQRHGLGLSGGPWFVHHILPHTNQVVLGRRQDLSVSRFSLTGCNWFTNPTLNTDILCQVQVRYHSKEIPARLYISNQTEAEIILQEQSHDVTPGQSAVCYQDDLLLGGGHIARILSS